LKVKLAFIFSQRSLLIFMLELRRGHGGSGLRASRLGRPNGSNRGSANCAGNAQPDS
jgi:hypothetical protein